MIALLFGADSAEIVTHEEGQVLEVQLVFRADDRYGNAKFFGVTVSSYKTLDANAEYLRQAAQEVERHEKRVIRDDD